jgi:hypothetical protein
LKPFHVTADINGWSLDGLNTQGVPYGQLSLTRIQQKQTGQQADMDVLTPAVLPAFVHVSRTLQFGLHWQVVTKVTRQSPPGSPVSVLVPLLPGEQVISDRVPVTEGQVRVSMGATDRFFTWTSRIEPVQALTLTAGNSRDYLETWQMNVSPIWHVAMDGIAPIHHQDKGNNWLPTWNPWPGEKLVLRVTRPEGVAGNTVTIDYSKLAVNPGQRATDTNLTFKLRASQGGKYDVTLPDQAQLQGVKINGKSQPIRQDGQKVTLPVVPGQQQFEISLRSLNGMEAIWNTPQVKLPGDSVNASIKTSVPRDRWILWVSGPDLGPAVLIWGILIVLLLVAYGLYRAGIGRVPMSYLSWALLAVGLSQVEVLFGIIVVAWFFSLYARQQMSVDTVKWKFNLTQIGLVILTIVSMSILLWVIQQGLLGIPEMQIVGYGSTAYQLNWYQDRVQDMLPQALVVSVPLMVYRLLMLAWALWLAYSLLKWLKWAWQCFSTGGLWRSVKLAHGKAKPKESQA